MDNVEAVALNECPFCGSDANLIPHATVGDAIRFYIKCEHCGVRTGHMHPEAEAIAAWNTRAAMQPEPAPVVEAVAWMYEMDQPDGQKMVFVSLFRRPRHVDCGWTETPLAATPALALAAAALRAREAGHG